MNLHAGRPVFCVACLVVGAFAAVCGAQSAPALPASQITTQPDETFSVKRFVFQGNTVYSSTQLNRVIDQALSKRLKTWPTDRTVSADDLEEARLAISQFYADAGYVNSGAILPNQKVSEGNVLIQIIEGKLTDVNVGFRGDNARPVGHHLLRTQYIIRRIEHASGPPLNINELKDELEILRQDPNIQTMNAELKPGLLPGEGVLDIQVQESNPFHLALQFSDRRPPSVGSTALDVIASDTDLTGRGDRFSLLFDVLNGPINDLQLASARDFNLDYTIPITPSDITFNVDFGRTDTVVSDPVFAPLDISSESDNLSFTLREPVYRKPIADLPERGRLALPSIEFDLFESAAIRNNRSTLLGQPFSLSPGDVNGTEYVTELRLGQELILRNDRDAFSCRSTFNFGVPWFNSTSNKGEDPGGRFVTWLGQTQYIHLFSNSGIQLVLRGSTQIADRRLLTLEQFALGGMDTVRGYPENDLVRDQGVAGTLEVHVPVFRKGGLDVVTLVPFFDIGYGWDRSPRSQPSETLDAAGLGLLFNPTQRVSAKIFYGPPLQNHTNSQRDIQDLGLHFNVTVELL